jgi:hypothetical protein
MEKSKMKQTRFFLFLVLFSFCVTAQNRPGVDYFAQLGFFDFIINYFGLTLPETGITGLT